MQPRAQLIPMGLTRTYVPNWTKEQVARELAANCMDADPDAYNILGTDDDPDALVFDTETMPRVAECIFLGLSSSRDDPNKIGQFGEGMKLAALVATRTRGAHMKIWVLDRNEQGYQITFRFKELLGEDVLHAAVQQITLDDFAGTNVRFRCEVKMRGIRDVLDGRIIPDCNRSKLWPRPDGSKQVIACKGIVIAERKLVSLFSYNLNALRLNRDRDIPDEFSVKWEAARLLCNIMEKDPKVADKLIAEPTCWEHEALDACTPSTDAKAALSAAFERRWGTDALIATPHSDDHDREVATLAGHRIVSLPAALGNSILSGGTIRSVRDAIPRDHDFTPMSEQSLFQSYLDEANALVGIIDPGIPTFIQICHDDGNRDGTCCWTGTSIRISLNVRLCNPGMRQERMKTILHELGHVHGFPQDGTVRFERNLETIAARLADLYLMATSVEAKRDAAHEGATSA